jgi:hypothetical protein
MRIERILTVPATPGEARAQITTYLEQVGYQLAGSGPIVLRFQRSTVPAAVTGSQPQTLPSKVAVEVRTGQDQKTWVCAIAAIDLGAFANKDTALALGQREMDGLVTALGGEEVHMGTAAVQSLAPQFTIRQTGPLLVDPRVKSGANWFFWIAGLSIFNTIIFRLGIELTFLIGLAGTVFVEGVGIAVADELPGSATLVMVLALFAEILVAGIFVLFGVLARKGLRWAFIVGMVLYALDGVLWLVLGVYLPAGFHLLALWFIFGGLRALGKK